MSNAENTLAPLPVTIDGYFFPEVSIKANPAFNPAQAADVMKIHVAVHIDDQAEQGKITARARVRSDEDGNIPYLVAVEAFGTFTPATGVTAETAAVFPVIAQVLIGGAREMIAMVTARGPWPPTVLAIIDLGKNEAP